MGSEKRQPEAAPTKAVSSGWFWGCMCISGKDEDEMIIFSWKKIDWGKKERKLP